MKENKKNRINRREFFKVLGAGALATTSLYGCSPKENSSDKAAESGEIPKDKMTFRTNPHSGDKVSLLGYGCMRWPMKKKEDGSGDEIDQETVNRLVDYAIAHGVNYFDTAPVYIQGWSEASTGIALSRHPRDKYFIATKSSRNNTLESGIAMYRQSMKDLQVDYIDYYLLHSVGGGNGISTFESRFIDNGLLDFFLKEREAGRIRNLGWSFHGAVEVFDHLLAMDIQWDFCQIQLNYQDWNHASGRNVNAEYLYTELVKHNVPAVIMEPLLGGRLASINAHMAEMLKRRRPQESIASWAFRFAGTPPGVLTVLSGMTYMEHLQDNLRTYSPLESLSNEEDTLLKEIADMMVELPLIRCTNCQYCMPCPYGIDIPGVFLHYNKCVTEGNVPKSSQDENYRKARRAFLIGYDRSVPRLRQANHCIGCDKCREHCPQRINIPKEMEKIDEYVELLKQGKEFQTE